MKVVTMCGSMKFADKMPKFAGLLETKYGFCVLQPVYEFGEENLTKEELQNSEAYKNIVDAHFKKIDISDAIFVVDVDGYIGSSTKREIEYAKKNGKQVLYYSDGV